MTIPAGHRSLKKTLQPDLLKKATFVSDGDEALDFLFHREEFASIRENSCPSIIFLDLQMSRVDGFIVLKEMRATNRLANLPVIVLTTLEFESDRKHALEYGAKDYIVKPWTLSDLSDEIDATLYKWLGYRQSDSGSEASGRFSN